MKKEMHILLQNTEKVEKLLKENEKLFLKEKKEHMFNMDNILQKNQEHIRLLQNSYRLKINTLTNNMNEKEKMIENKKIIEKNNVDKNIDENDEKNEMKILELENVILNLRKIHSERIRTLIVKDPKDPKSSHLDPDSSHLDPKWMKVKSSAERRGEGTEQKTQKPSILSTSDLSSSSYDQSLR